MYELNKNVYEMEKVWLLVYKYICVLVLYNISSINITFKWNDYNK